jgi:hypothetical protein
LQPVSCDVARNEPVRQATVLGEGFCHVTIRSARKLAADLALTPTERARMLALLEAFCHAYCGGQNPVADLLKRAQSGRLDDLVEALVGVNGLPAIQRRRVLGSYGARVSPQPRTIVNGKAKGAAA